MIWDRLKYFYFKKYPQDFIVEEKLKNLPKWVWHVFYVFFEKKFVNTMDIIKYLWKSLNLKRKHFGIWWLKDKDGITRQWISIYKRTLESRWWIDKFLKELSKYSKILKYTWSDTLLKVWDIQWNLFFIRLRPKIKFTEEIINNIEKSLEKIKKEWFPNYFWYQRFWKKGRNVKLWFKFLKWEIDIKDPFEKQFKLQAVSSWIFNKYIDLRIEKWYFWDILYGDIILYKEEFGNKLNFLEKGKQKLILINEKNINFFKEKNVIPTGSVIGYDILFPEKWTISYNLEMENLNKENFNIKFLEIYKKFNIYWIRRNIKEYIYDLRYKWDWEDLLLMFELSTGSYASVVIWWLDHMIDENLV